MDKIYELLSEMGMSKHLLGFEFSHDGIEYLLEKKQKGERAIMMQLYTEIGEKHQVAPIAVERNIRTALRKTIAKGNKEYFERLFPGFEKVGVTVMEFLYQATYMIQNMADGQKSTNCGAKLIETASGYKAFYGIMRVIIDGEAVDIEDGWIYNPGYGNWYNSKQSFSCNQCTIISIM